MVKYPFSVQKILYYTTQHDDGRLIDFLQQYSLSPRQTTANNCKTAFSLHVVESASDDYNFLLNILLTHSRSLKVVLNDILQKGISPY